MYINQEDRANIGLYCMVCIVLRSVMTGLQKQNAHSHAYLCGSGYMDVLFFKFKRVILQSAGQWC